MLQTISRLSTNILEITLNLKLETTMSLKSLIVKESRLIMLEFILGSFEQKIA